MKIQRKETNNIRLVQVYNIEKSELLRLQVYGN